MLFDPVGSTSWPGRHARSFARLAELFADRPVDPTVIVIGPGGVTALLAPLLRDAADPRRNRWRRLRTDLARCADQFLRRIPGLALVSIEPREIVESIGRPHQLIVVDRSRRVLAAARRDLPRAQTILIDLDRQPLPVHGDVVVAFNVVSRTRRPADAIARVLAAVRPGGLLLFDDRSAARWLPTTPRLEPLGEKIYRRLHA